MPTLSTHRKGSLSQDVPRDIVAWNLKTLAPGPGFCNKSTSLPMQTAITLFSTQSLMQSTNHA